MSNQHTGASVTDNEEHISDANGLNAKKVAAHGINTLGTLLPVPVPLIDEPFDYVGFSNPDVNDNYQTMQFRQGGAAGTVVRTLSLTYDGSSNLTSIARS